MSDDKTTASYRADLFMYTVNNLSGHVADKLSQQLNEVIRAVQATEKNGKLQLTLEVKSDSDGIYLIEPKITKTLPKRSLGKSIFFGTPEGNLTVNRQDQGSLFDTKDLSQQSIPEKDLSNQ